MSLLDRMIVREIFLPLAVGLLAILQLLLVVQLLQLNEVVFGSAVTLEDLVRLTSALAPHFLVIAVPLAYMLGLQLAVGRMAADREVLALSCGGTSPLALYRMPMAIAVALGIGVAGLVRWAEPWGLRQLDQVLNAVIKRNLQSGLLPGVFNDQLPRFVVYVASEEGGLWQGVLIEDDVGDGDPFLALAQEGQIVDSGGEVLTLNLRRGELHRTEPGGETVARFAEGTFPIGVQERVASKNRFRGAEGAIPYRELRKRIAQARAERRFDDARRLEAEEGRRWALPLACLAFAVLGLPLAVATRGARGSGYLVTLGAFILFYTLSRMGLALAEKGALAPVLAAFLPDLAVAALGAGFTLKLLETGVGKPRG